jgi:YD repeat-containing protein
MRKQEKVILIVLLLPFTIAVIFLIINSMTSVSYSKAQELMVEGRYDKAEGIFLSLNDYKDSKELVTEARYKQALLNIESENYNAAYEDLLELGEYKDAKLHLSKYKCLLKEERHTDFNNNKTNTTYIYDKKGNLTQEIKDGKTTEYEYNSLGQLSKKTNDKTTYYYNPNGDIVKQIHENETYETVYDDKGRKKETYSYNTNGMITSRVTHQYLENAKESYDTIETGVFYGFDGNIDQSWVAKVWHDEYGNEVLQEREVLNDGESTSSFTFENRYVYDDMGNWVKNYEYANGVLQMKRIQEFDQNGNIVKKISYNKEGALISETTYLYEHIYVE